VRLDSSDLIALSFGARQILDAGGLTDTMIFPSGGVDEHFIAAAVARGAPIDAFGVGRRLGVSADAPYLDMAYKLVAYDGRPVLKLSAGKASWPGPKQVWRSREADGGSEDHVTLADEPGPPAAEPLLAPVMADGRRLSDEPLAARRARAQREVAALPAEMRRLVAPSTANVRLGEGLVRLHQQLTARARQGSAAGALDEGAELAPSWITHV
jgi:nicotinate phosphoribosyltransferase